MGYGRGRGGFILGILCLVGRRGPLTGIVLVLAVLASGCRSSTEPTTVAGTPPLVPTMTATAAPVGPEPGATSAASPVAMEPTEVSPALATQSAMGQDPTQTASLPPTATGQEPAHEPTQPAQTEPAPPTPEPEQPAQAEFGFAVFSAVPEEEANAANAERIRAELKRLKELGFNIVVQSFPVASTEADWKAFLDVAADEGLRVVPAIWSQPPVWSGGGFDLGTTEQLMRTMKDHPALFGFFLVDEPFHKKHGWDITADRLQQLYQQAREIAPHVPMVVQFSREIQRTEERNDPRFAFRKGMCDICVISALEFRDYGGGRQFYRGDLIANHTVSRAAIKRENPDAQIWSTLQVFGSSAGGSSYYMPSPAELRQAVDLLFGPELQAAGELDGMVWQLWASPSRAQDAKQDTLADAQFEQHRQIVKDTAASLGLLARP